MRPIIDLPRPQLFAVTTGLRLSQMLFALDSSIVATAMPCIISELAGLVYYAWVTTAYLVTSTTVVPISGKLGDLFIRKRFARGGMIRFVTASTMRWRPSSSWPPESSVWRCSSPMFLREVPMRGRRTIPSGPIVSATE